MLRKLASPRRSTRFSAGAKPAAATASAQSLSALSTLPEDATTTSSADAKSADSPSKKSSSKKNKKTPTPPTELPTSTAPQGLGLDLSAVAKVDDSNAGASDQAAVKPPPLLRTPRKMSVFDEPTEAKPTSPSSSPTKKNEAKARRSKRDSLGLKGLLAKREKANATDAASAEAKQAANSPSKKQEAKKEPVSTTMTKNEATTDSNTTSNEPALSPIRRKPRPAPDATENAPSSSSTMPTLREAATRLPRRSGSTRSDAVPPLQQPELHIIGEIVGGDGFGNSSDGFCCKWSVDYGNQWIHISGDQIGQTQIDYTANGFPDESSLVWNHPLDLHFAASAFHGWPKLLLQVWRVDAHMKMNVVGYGFVHFPYVPGSHRLKVAMWRPMGSGKEEMAAALLGHTPELATDEVLFNTAWADRCRLKTIAMGHVFVDVGIITRHFEVGRLKS